MSFGPQWQDVTGRMLSLASSDDGKLVFAGSFSSGLWVSTDGGESWVQLTWEQPAPDQFGVPGALGGCCIPSVAVGPDSARWFVNRNPRLLADISGDGIADIVGFGDTGVWTALSNGDGTFQAARLVLADLGYTAGGWRVDKHPRFLADLTGDGKADIVGFGDAGVWTALSNGDGTFQAPQLVLADFGYVAGGWRVNRHPRYLADLTGDGRADIVGFGDAGVWTALSNGDGTFQTPQLVVANFGYTAGGWRVTRHPRCLADLAGDGRADIVGFGDAGVWTALGNGDGTFQAPQLVLANFGYAAGGWRVNKHPRYLADLTGDGRADIVGFGDAGVWTALGNGDGTFQAPQLVLADLGYAAGGWRVDKHPRLLADLTGDGKADIVGFGDAGVWTALGRGDGTFQAPQLVLADLGYAAGGWRVDKHPRLLADVTGDGKADIVGFGDAGVYVAPANADGAVPGPLRFVLPNFGNLLTVLAIARSDREVDDAGIWRSSDAGATWAPVHSFPRPGGGPPAAGQLVWAPGTAHLVFAAGQDSLAVSRDAGASWWTAIRTTRPIIQRPVAANHVAVAATPAGTLNPPAVYALAFGSIEVSLDGGATWVPDAGNLPGPMGSVVGLSNSNNECVMVVSPRSPFEVFVTRDANAAPGLPQLWRGDYSNFAQTMASTWQSVPIPAVGDQDSGNVWLAITRSGQGEALFYGPQRFFGDNLGEAWVAPLDPQSESDWHQLDATGQVHVDLHGLFLSPDFHAGFDRGNYVATAGTVWLLSDGGIDRSTDGGITFQPAGSISSLSTVNFAGAAIAGHGPLLSLNTGDNDGFASSDGGQSWSTQQYGGGDNDTSWSDPLRPHSMLIFTPRWDKTLALYETQPGNLPDICSSADRQIIPGPPLRTGSTLWNASSGYVIRGYRPLIQSLSADDPALPTDCAVIRYFGNFHRDDPPVTYVDHLAVALRARDLRAVNARSDWDTPGGWLVDRHPRLLADLTGDGKADIVGFGDAGVWTALSNGDGTFQTPRFVLADLGYDAGGWRVDKHPRFLTDLTGDGKADIVGFGDAGVWTALGNGDGTFQAPRFVLADLGYAAGGWRVDKHPRLLADLTGDGKADIVGFGDAGVWTALSNGDGTFQAPQFVLADLGYTAGGWRVDKHPRFLVDITGDGGADIVGFGDTGVYVALSHGDGTFVFTPQVALDDFGVNQGWRVEAHLRCLADVTGEGRADIVGFGDAGVHVSPALTGGSFREQPLFVIPNFGHRESGPVEQIGPFLPDPGIGVLQASGGRERTVFYVGGDTSRRLWKWTQGMTAWEQLIPGRDANQAKRFFVSPYDPNLLYVIDGEHIKRTDDGGSSWQVDASLERMVTCNGLIPANRDEAGETTQVVLSDMQFDPFDPSRRFAVGAAGAFTTTDGVTWQRVLDTGAMRGLPTNCYFDQWSTPSNPSLYVGFAGRGIVKISGIEPGGGVILRAATLPTKTEAGPLDRPTTRVRTADGRLGTAEIAPDDRYFITLDDGQSVVADIGDVTIVNVAGDRNGARSTS
ncbi:MAG: VCBS repeat-containing protein [Xanthomonadales bacterium]|nr:VCBS repeat-containing protein [Xanthomonadales bacterium]